MAKSNDAPAEVFIFEEIGDGWFGGMTDKAFAELLAPLKGQSIDVHINSPGGDVFQGIAIANLIAAHDGHVRTFNDGLVASAATLPFVMGDESIMPSNSTLMIHDPWTISMGNAAEMRGTADLLDFVKGQLVDTYLGKSTATAEKLSELMSAETWLSAEAAKELGLVDQVTASGRAAASASLARFKGAFRNIPTAMLAASVSARDKQPEGERRETYEDFLRRNIAASRKADAKQILHRQRMAFNRATAPEPTYENSLRRQINSLKTGKAI